MAENEERKPLEPVAQYDASKVRKSTGRQFLSSFIVEDIGIVKDYLLFDILVPAVKNTIVDTACSAINMIFNGNNDNWRRYSSNNYGRSNRTSYSSGSRVYRSSDSGYFREEMRESRSYDTPIWNKASSMDYLDLPFATRPKAEEVLDSMREILERYPVVSVADFYELSSYDYGNNYQCHNIGWTREMFKDVTITWSRGAWVIALPRAVAIN